MFNAPLLPPLLFEAAVKSAAILTVTLSVGALLRRAPAAARHLVLLAGIAVLLGLPLLIPFVPRHSLPTLPAQRVQPAAPIAAPILAVPPPAASSLTVPLTAPVFLTLPPAPVTLTPKPVPHSRPLVTWLLPLWLLGVLLCAGRILAAQAGVWRLIRRCPPLPDTFRESLGPEVHPAALLRLAPAGTPPLVWGSLRPVLLLPADALAWPTERLRAVLLHETAHLGRSDWLTQTLTQAACALYWFNPLVWLTASQLQAEAERACDDAVLLAGIPPADYAQDLLAVARSLTAARMASAGAVTMARRSPVRSRLEAILDTRRPRRSVTRRAAAFSLLLALAVAVPLASLRPAARADAPTTETPPAAPITLSTGVPTEADIAKVQQHLEKLEQAQRVYEWSAAQPNMLSPAQIAEVDQWIFQREEMRRQVDFNVNEVESTTRLRSEAKKPHTQQERQQIWAQIFAFDQAKSVILKQQQGESNLIAQFQAKVAALPVYQRNREEKMYAFDNAIAVDKTRIEAMQMERAEGYSLHLNQDTIAMDARMGLQWEKQGHMSRADWIHTEILNSKLNQEKRLDDADVDSLIAILKEPLTATSFSHAIVMAFFRNMHDAKFPPVPAVQQQKIREAVTPFLTSRSRWPRQDKWDHLFAKQVLKEYGVSVPAHAAARISQPPNAKGILPMTPPKSLKPALLAAVALTAITSQPLPVVHAAPIKQIKPISAPVRTQDTNKTHDPIFPAISPGSPYLQEIKQTTPATFGTKKIFLQNLTPDTILSFLHWNQTGALPEGVKQVSALPQENALLVVATPAGFAQVQRLLKTADVAPRQVEIRLAAANVPKANLNAFGVDFVLMPQNQPPTASVTNKPALPSGTLLYLDGNIAAQLLTALRKQSPVTDAPLITTSNNVQASINISGSQPGIHSLTVTPRINNDDTITLLIHLAISDASPSKGHPHQAPVNRTQEINTLRTIRSGDTLALNISAPKSAAAGAHSLLLFVSPTIVETDKPIKVTIQ